MKNKLKIKKILISSLALCSSFFCLTSYAQNNVINSIDKIKANNKIRMAFRENSSPFSFLDDRRPFGYSIDICSRVAQKLQSEINSNFIIEYVTANEENINNLFETNKIDLDCMAYNNINYNNYNFTIPYYISGDKILIKNNNNINNLQLTDILKNKKISIVKNTAINQKITAIQNNFKIKYQLQEFNDFDNASKSFTSEQSDILIADEALLLGLKNKMNNSDNYFITQEYLNINPVAIMIRKNDKIKPVLDKIINEMFNNGEINIIYNKWFNSPIPPRNESLKLLKNQMFQDLIRFPVDVVGD